MLHRPRHGRPSTPSRQARSRRLAKRRSGTAHAGGPALPPAPYRRRTCTGHSARQRLRSPRAFAPRRPHRRHRHRAGPRRGRHRAAVGRGPAAAGDGAVRPRAGAAAGHAAALPAPPTAAPWIRAWRCTSRRPHSYTGEDVLELQAHGGPVLLQLLLARCLEAGRTTACALAEPGEFTAARLSQRQARPGAGRGGGRPHRRQHRGRGPVGRPIARRRFFAEVDALARAAGASCACWSRPRWTSRRRRSTSCSRRGALEQLRASRRRAAALARPRAPGCAAARGHRAWCWPASPMSARARC